MDKHEEEKLDIVYGLTAKIALYLAEVLSAKELEAYLITCGMAADSAINVVATLSNCKK